MHRKEEHAVVALYMFTMSDNLSCMLIPSTNLVDSCMGVITRENLYMWLPYLVGVSAN